MGFTFEVKETDLLGRVGELRVGSKTLETPYMFPVVHPVSQAVRLEELTAMGFNGVMTNSYIIHSRKKEEALEKGVHSLIGFEGVVMTDSGGYQVLEYGDLGVDYREMASFQSAIGSELAVTLDRPTGYPQKRSVAMATVDYSLKNALATLDEFGASATNWVGPVQGGVYLDLIAKSTRALVKGGFEFLALGSPTRVMENYMFSDLVRMVVATRKVTPYSIPLHLFGAGHPLTMPMAVALGCDTFDSASYILFARSNRYMTSSGVLTLDSMKRLPCSCGVCMKQTVKGMLDLPREERIRQLSLHNLYVLREELEKCKEAVSEGRLWDLVEERSMAHPKLRAAFAQFVEASPLLAEGTPSAKSKGLLIRDIDDLSRPELIHARARLASATKRRSGTAYLLSPGESRPKSRAAADLYKMNPVLGPYPAELDFVYPFGQTVVGSPMAPEALVEGARALRKMGYKKVLTKRSKRKVQPRSRRNRRGASPSPR